MKPCAPGMGQLHNLSSIQLLSNKYSRAHQETKYKTFTETYSNKNDSKIVVSKKVVFC